MPLGEDERWKHQNWQSHLVHEHGWSQHDADFPETFTGRNQLRAEHETDHAERIHGEVDEENELMHRMHGRISSGGRILKNGGQMSEETVRQLVKRNPKLARPDLFNDRRGQ
jgi:hypothetical protein